MLANRAANRRVDSPPNEEYGRRNYVDFDGAGDWSAGGQPGGAKHPPNDVPRSPSLANGLGQSPIGRSRAAQQLRRTAPIFRVWNAARAA